MTRAVRRISDDAAWGHRAPLPQPSGSASSQEPLWAHFEERRDETEE